MRHALHAVLSRCDSCHGDPTASLSVDPSELQKYYERIIRAVEIPVVIQDASGYVGQSLPIELQAKLVAEYGDRVVLKPEASPIGPRLPTRFVMPQGEGLAS